MIARRALPSPVSKPMIRLHVEVADPGAGTVATKQLTLPAVLRTDQAVDLVLGWLRTIGWRGSLRSAYLAESVAVDDQPAGWTLSLSCSGRVFRLRAWAFDQIPGAPKPPTGGD